MVWELVGWQLCAVWDEIRFAFVKYHSRSVRTGGGGFCGNNWVLMHVKGSVSYLVEGSEVWLEGFTFQMTMG